jgi:hypothetical protein
MASGFTSTTVDNLLLDAGYLFYNFDEVTGEGTALGATKGGSELAIEIELRQPEIDGTKGRFKGGQLVVSENAQLTVNLAEVTAKNLSLALPTSSLDTTGIDKDVITSKGKIELTDYLDNVAFVGKKANGDEVVIMLFNVISLEGLAMTFEDNNEATLPIVFGAHKTDGTTSPYKIISDK